MFCPKCKDEFREGFTHCSDCNIPLVPELPKLPIEPESPVEEQVEIKNKIIFTTFDPIEANLVKSYLESNGIIVFILDEYMNTMNPFSKVAFGGIKLAVPEEQENMAIEVLKNYCKLQGTKYSNTGKLTQFSTPESKSFLQFYLVISLIFFCLFLYLFLR